MSNKMSNSEDRFRSQYKHEKVYIMLDLDKIKERVYGYVSNVASRISNDEQGFDKTSLNIDNDAFIFGDGLFGIIAETDAALMSRLSVYEVFVEIKDDYIGVDIMHCPSVSPSGIWVSTLTRYLYNYYCTSLIYAWFELLGIQDKFLSYSRVGVDETLNQVRIHIDSAYTKPNRIKFNTLGL